MNAYHRYSRTGSTFQLPFITMASTWKLLNQQYQNVKNQDLKTMKNIKTSFPHKFYIQKNF